MNELREEIKEKASVIASIVESGSKVEIWKNKDGLVIDEVKRKRVQEEK